MVKLILQFFTENKLKFAYIKEMILTLYNKQVD